MSKSRRTTSEKRHVALVYEADMRRGYQFSFGGKRLLRFNHYRQNMYVTFLGRGKPAATQGAVSSVFTHLQSINPIDFLIFRRLPPYSELYFPFPTIIDLRVPAGVWGGPLFYRAPLAGD